MVICECFNVSEDKIRKAIAEKGYTEVDEVYNHFKIEACGSCMPAIMEILDELVEA